MNPVEFRQTKSKRKLSMITCYDSSFAALVEQSPIDSILVGDSSAMVMQGYNDTLNSNLDSICLFTQSVARAVKSKLIVADMPFMSNRKGLEAGALAAERLMKAGAHAVKIEGRKGNEELIEHLVQSGIPVMGHLGLTPQSVFELGGYKVQGREAKQAEQIIKDSKKLQKCGVFSLVLECVPSSLAREISQELEIPTIGIGAGPDTDGQVLVLQDMLGMGLGRRPKFVREFIDGRKLIAEAFSAYHAAIENKTYPSIEESYE